MKRIRPSDKSQSMIINAQLPLKTRVDFGSGIRLRSGQILKQLHAGQKVLFLSQTSLPTKFTDSVRDALIKEGFQIVERLLPDGEEAKSMQQLLECFRLMQENEFSRSDSVLALGGGALSDLAGFCASTYLRGIKAFLLPTTLLAQVDASIGGKTGVNLEAGKNLAGSFYFPASVIVDPDFLSTLPERELQSGMGEIIKYAYIENTIAQLSDYKPGPTSLLRAIQKNFPAGLELENPFVEPLIAVCIRMKLAVVIKDPFEERLRRCLNLGHTLAHGLEKVSNYKISHGEAVAIGTVFAFKLANSIGLIDQDSVGSAEEQMRILNLPTEIPAEINRESLAKAVAFDKKRQSEHIKFVLPEKSAGTVNLDISLEISELSRFISEYK